MGPIQAIIRRHAIGPGDFLSFGENCRSKARVYFATRPFTALANAS